MPLKHGLLLLASELVFLLSSYLKYFYLFCLFKGLIFLGQIKISALWNFHGLFLFSGSMISPSCGLQYWYDKANIKMHHMLVCEHCILNYCFLITWHTVLFLQLGKCFEFGTNVLDIFKFLKLEYYFIWVLFYWRPR